MVPNRISTGALQGPRAEAMPAAAATVAAQAVPATGRVGRVGPGLAGPPGVDFPQRQMVVYQVARSLAGRPLSDMELRELRKADQAVRDTRAALPYGRANVIADIEATQHESSRRALVGMEMVGGVQQLGRMSTAHRAALSAAVGAAVCDGHSDVVASLYAQRMRHGQALQLVVNPQTPHRWTEVLCAVLSSEGEVLKGVKGAQIVMDAWAQGPAVLLEDAQPLYRASGVRSAQTIRFHTAATLHRDYVERLDLLQPAAQQRLTEVLPEWRDQQVRWELRTFGTMNVISDTLAREAQARLPAADTNNVMALLGAELVAVAAQREGGSSVAQAASRAGEVLTDVRRLPAIDNPPPITSPL